jgi:hypothetical protein
MRYLHFILSLFVLAGFALTGCGVAPAARTPEELTVAYLDALDANDLEAVAAMLPYDSADMRRMEARNQLDRWSLHWKPRQVSGGRAEDVGALISRDFIRVVEDGGIATGYSVWIYEEYDSCISVEMEQRNGEWTVNSFYANNIYENKPECRP